MQRRSFIRNSGLSLAAIALLNNRSLASFLNDPSFKVTMLTNDIGVFTEKGGTIMFMLTKEGSVVVDSQFPDTAQHLIDEIKKKTTEPFRLLINTHHHGDHTSGNIAFKSLVPHVLAHVNSKTNQLQNAIKQKTEDKQLYPDQTYSDTWCEKIGQSEVCLHYFGAGHTNGDSLVHLKDADIVHMGDLVFNRRHPYVDKNAGADISSWITLLETATKTFSSKTRYVCGHAREGFDIVLNAADLLAFRDYLGNVLRFTESEIKAGKTKDDIIKAKGIPGSPEWQGDGIERPLSAAYLELTADK